MHFYNSNYNIWCFTYLGVERGGEPKELLLHFKWFLVQASNNS